LKRRRRRRRMLIIVISKEISQFVVATGSKWNKWGWFEQCMRWSQQAFQE
jgi:hypothetical protein